MGQDDDSHRSTVIVLSVLTFIFSALALLFSCSFPYALSLSERALGGSAVLLFSSNVLLELLPAWLAMPHIEQLIRNRVQLSDNQYRIVR